MKSERNQEEIEKEKSPASKHHLRNTKSIVILITVILVILLISPFKGNCSLSNRIDKKVIGEEGTVSTVTSATILDVLDISELSTAEYVYNSIARAYEENSTAVKYYVSYEGTITAGIDFKAVHVDVNEEDKTITITLPEIAIQDITVNPGTLEYIFVDKKCETEDIMKESYELCQKDLEEKANNEEDLLLLAKENAEAVVTALIKPWIMQIDNRFSINVE